MPKSRNRGGAKAHRKKVVARSQKIANQQKAFQKILTQQIEAFKQMNESKSGQTETQ